MLTMFKQNYVLVIITFLLSYVYTNLGTKNEDEQRQALTSSLLVSIGVFFIVYIHTLVDNTVDNVYQGIADF